MYSIRITQLLCQHFENGLLHSLFGGQDLNASLGEGAETLNFSYSDQFFLIKAFGSPKNPSTICHLECRRAVSGNVGPGGTETLGPVVSQWHIRAPLKIHKSLQHLART